MRIPLNVRIFLVVAGLTCLLLPALTR